MTTHSGDIDEVFTNAPPKDLSGQRFFSNLLKGVRKKGADNFNAASGSPEDLSGGQFLPDITRYYGGEKGKGGGKTITTSLFTITLTPHCKETLPSANIPKQSQHSYKDPSVSNLSSNANPHSGPPAKKSSPAILTSMMNFSALTTIAIDGKPIHFLRYLI
uniref:Uncharacterized protein n=1 Tax=Chaetoceros debilis TaxID=122233 RepID=A0A7S3V7S0_9STRA|mmetsp:Transcript_7495/g.10757  ORF Transcript_7495/g.10757 Transcript_7495/m.10757 type:complete len:161 (+) Transcript_7495:191-673(+)